MTKRNIERLIDLEIEKNRREIRTHEAITLGRLRQEFEMWEPDAAPPAREEARCSCDFPAPLCPVHEVEEAE